VSFHSNSVDQMNVPAAVQEQEEEEQTSTNNNNGQGTHYQGQQTHSNGQTAAAAAASDGYLEIRAKPSQRTFEQIFREYGYALFSWYILGGRIWLLPPPWQRPTPCTRLALAMPHHNIMDQSFCCSFSTLPTLVHSQSGLFIAVGTWCDRHHCHLVHWAISKDGKLGGMARSAANCAVFPLCRLFERRVVGHCHFDLYLCGILFSGGRRQVQCVGIGDSIAHSAIVDSIGLVGCPWRCHSSLGPTELPLLWKCIHDSDLHRHHV
jgi:hypothetical protein